MMDEFNDNNNLNDSSINKAKFTAEEFGKQEKIRKLKEAAEEFRKHANKKREEIENEACGYFNSLLSNIDLNSGRSHSRTFNSEFNAEGEEDYFTDGIGSLLAKLFKFFNFVASALGMDAESQTYKKIMREKKENWVAAIMKLLKDKFREIVRKILAKDLSFKERLEEEIKSLIDKINSGELSEEELVEALKRLDLLQNIKLKIQMFCVGWLIVILAGFLSIELKASSVEAEAPKIEVGKEKEEKTVSKEKETTKEVRENVETEVKVTEKEMPKVVIPKSILDHSSGVARPISLTPAERDLLPDFLKNGLPPLFKDDMNRENREASKQNEVKEKQENKQAEPKKEVCPPKPAEQPKAKELMVGTNQNLGNDFSARKARILSIGESFNEKESYVKSRKIEDFYDQASVEQTRSEKNNNFSKEETPIKPKLKIDDFYNQASAKQTCGEKVPSGINDVEIKRCVGGQLVGKNG